MVTINDVITAILKAKGMRKIKGSEDDVAPIIPYILMDTAYTLYCKHIRTLKCSFKAKKARNSFGENYGKFNRDMFRCLNAAQAVFVTDIMDRWEKFIEKDLFITHIQITNLFWRESRERQDILSEAMLIDIHCQCALLVYGMVYKNGRLEDKQNPYLRLCRQASREFLKEYYGDGPDIDPNTDKNVNACVDILCKRQREFLRLYKDEGEKISV